MTELLLLLLLVILFLLQAIPGYTLAKRRGVRGAGLAFVPLVGFWIVVFRSIGTGRWLSVLVGVVFVVLPIVGFACAVWAGIQVPVVHRRSRWWTAALAVPGVNLVGYCVYAFTLPTLEAVELPPPH
jgi:hypothetical protein